MGPLEDAQQPEPYVAANPTRPLTCAIIAKFKYEQPAKK